jgi:hypothetical protein
VCVHLTYLHQCIIKERRHFDTKSRSRIGIGVCDRCQRLPSNQVVVACRRVVQCMRVIELDERIANVVLERKVCAIVRAIDTHQFRSQIELQREVCIGSVGCNVQKGIDLNRAIQRGDCLQIQSANQPQSTHIDHRSININNQANGDAIMRCDSSCDVALECSRAKSNCHVLDMR